MKRVKSQKDIPLLETDGIQLGKIGNSKIHSPSPAFILFQQQSFIYTFENLLVSKSLLKRGFKFFLQKGRCC